MSAIRELPLGPRSESAGRHRRTPWPLLTRMDLGSAGQRCGRSRCQGLLFGFGLSVTSDAEERVPTGGELTLFQAVGRGA